LSISLYVAIAALVLVVIRQAGIFPQRQIVAHESMPMRELLIAMILLEVALALPASLLLHLLRVH
jgi:hypothetical protein